MVQRIPRTPAVSTRGRLTVVELLIGIVLVGILLAIALPSYFGLRERAWDNEAKANLEAAVPAVEEYATETGTYSGMTLQALRAIDPTVQLDGDPVVTRTTYCIQSSVHRNAWKVEGPPSSAPVAGTCS
jgi:Tfp pilus assembly protein PilE